MQCKNCKTNITESDTYCSSCGGKIIRNRLTMRNLFEHFSEQFLNYDNKFLQTFIGLFTKPDDVIGGYISGVRKKYVNVISYFAISVTIAGLQVFVFKKFYPELFSFGSYASPGSEEIMQKILDLTQDYQAIAMMVNIPIYALLCKLSFFRNKTFNYTELLTIFMYIYSQTTIVSVIISVSGALLGLSFGSISMLLLPFLFVYTAYCLKKLYKLSFKGLLIKTLIFILILAVLYVLAILLAVAILFATGNMHILEQMAEAQKAAREASGN